MIHREDADPPGRICMPRTLETNMNNLSSVGDEIFVCNFYTLWYAGSSWGLSQRKLSSHAKNGAAYPEE